MNRIILGTLALLASGCIESASASTNQLCQHIVTERKSIPDEFPDYQFESDPLFIAPTTGWHVRSARLLPVTFLEALDYNSVQIVFQVWDADHLGNLGFWAESITVEDGGTGDWIPYVPILFSDVENYAPDGIPIENGAVVNFAQNKPIGDRTAGKYVVQFEMTYPCIN